MSSNTLPPPVEAHVSSDPPRTPGVLLSAFGRSERSSVSDAEWQSLRHHAKDRVRRFTAEIESRLINGDLRGAGRKARKMLVCPSVRLAALIRSNERLKRDNRRGPTALLAEMGNVDVFRRTASPMVERLPKPGGGARPIFKFGLVDGACAALIGMVLKPFARAHPRLACHPAQVMFVGGSPAACERLRSALERAPDGSVFVQIDVRRFYQSVACEGLARMTGLPPEVIHRHLSVEHLRVRVGNSEQYPTVSTDVGPGVRRSAERDPQRAPFEALGGLTTGSAASPTVAEIVMGHILRDAGVIEGPIVLIVYSDNIGAVLPSREAALAFQEATLRALRRSEAGPFDAGKVSIRDVGIGFNFLGYRWRKCDDQIVVEPARHRHELWQIEFGAEIMEAGFGTRGKTSEELRARLRGYANGKREWAGHLDFVREWDAVIDQQCALASSGYAADLAPGR